MAEMPYEMEVRQVMAELAATRARQLRNYPHLCKGAACPAFERCQARRAAANGRLDEGYPGGSIA